VAEEGAEDSDAGAEIHQIAKDRRAGSRRQEKRSLLSVQ
jgi:hypothetical protein